MCSLGELHDSGDIYHQNGGSHAGFNRHSENKYVELWCRAADQGNTKLGNKHGNNDWRCQPHGQSYNQVKLVEKEFGSLNVQLGVVAEYGPGGLTHKQAFQNQEKQPADHHNGDKSLSKQNTHGRRFSTRHRVHGACH